MRAGAGGGVGAELIGPMGATPMPPCFCIFFSSLSCRASSLLLSLISFFARTILHFSQVISTISCMGAPLTNFPMLSGFVRLIPQPVFFPFSVPWTTPPLIALMRKICMVILLSMVLHFKLYSILNKKASPPTEKIEKSIQKNEGIFVGCPEQNIAKEGSHAAAQRFLLQYVFGQHRTKIVRHCLRCVSDLLHA